MKEVLDIQEYKPRFFCRYRSEVQKTVAKRAGGVILRQRHIDMLRSKIVKQALQQGFESHSRWLL